MFVTCFFFKISISNSNRRVLLNCQYTMNMKFREKFEFVCFGFLCLILFQNFYWEFCVFPFFLHLYLVVICSSLSSILYICFLRVHERISDSYMVRDDFLLIFFPGKSQCFINNRCACILNNAFMNALRYIYTF